MARTSRPPVVPARGTGRAPWRTLQPAKLAAHLLATPQISDAAWTSELRLPGEARADFVCRVLGVRRPRAARQVARMAGVTATRGKGKRKSNAHLFRFDRQCGVDLVAGADEAGRAALAGPLVAAAVLLDYRTIRGPERRLLAELNDSKKISAAVRERLRPLVLDLAAAMATVIVPPDEIDRVGLHRSNLNALARALAGLQLPGGATLPNDTAMLVDGYALDGDLYRQVIRGDSQSAAIAAASIIAKTTRDRLMHDYAAAYPAYGFERHVGYITSAHSAAVVEHGPSPIHRLRNKARCYQQRLFDDPS